MSEYDSVQKGALKFKGVADLPIKKKKKKKKEKEAKKMLEREVSNSADPEASTSHRWVDKRTDAERAFDKTREKRMADEILEKASRTHKERILEFNSHLDTLTEHFDIPKVSWTK